MSEKKKRPAAAAAAAAAAMASARHAGAKRKSSDTSIPPPEKKREVEETKISDALSRLINPKTQRLCKSHLMTIYRHWRGSDRRAISIFAWDILSTSASQRAALLCAAMTGSDDGFRVPPQHIREFLRVLLTNATHDPVNQHFGIYNLLVAAEHSPHTRELVEHMILMYHQFINWTHIHWFEINNIKPLSAAAQDVIVQYCSGRNLCRHALESSWADIDRYPHIDMAQFWPTLDIVLRQAEPDGILHWDGAAAAERDVRYTHMMSRPMGDPQVLDRHITWTARADDELSQYRAVNPRTTPRLTWKNVERVNDNKRKWIAYTQQHAARYLAHRTDTTLFIQTVMPIRELCVMVTMFLGW